MLYSGGGGGCDTAVKSAEVEELCTGADAALGAPSLGGLKGCGGAALACAAKAYKLPRGSYGACMVACTMKTVQARGACMADR